MKFFNPRASLLSPIFIVKFLFTFISIPFLYFSTIATTLSYNIQTQPIQFFNLFEFPILSILQYNYLSLFIFISALLMLIFKVNLLLRFIFLSFFVFWSSHYETFLVFSIEIFANGLSLLLLFLIFLYIDELDVNFEKKRTSSYQYPLLLVLPAALFSSGLSKILSVGFSWGSSENIGEIFRYRYLLTNFSVLDSFAQNDALCSFIGYSVLLFELSGCLLLVFGKSYGLFSYGICATLFIVSTFFMLDIYEFLPLFIPALSIYFSPQYRSFS